MSLILFAHAQCVIRFMQKNLLAVIKLFAEGLKTFSTKTIFLTLSLSMDLYLETIILNSFLFYLKDSSFQKMEYLRSELSR